MVITKIVNIKITLIIIGKRDMPVTRVMTL
jgi:hypothetical protein